VRLRYSTFVALGLSLALLPWSGASGESGSRAELLVTAVFAREAPPYTEVLEGFRAELEQRGVRARYEVYALDRDAAVIERALSTDGQVGERIFLTLGSASTERVVASVETTPIIGALVLHASDIDAHSNATGVLLEHTTETQLRFLRRVLPDRKTVGVLFEPVENGERIEAAKSVARSLGVRLALREVREPSELPGALKSLATRTQVLWGIPDHTIYTPQTAKQLLVFSFRNRIPLSGLSSSWVKAGALYALERDYRDIGAQCAELATKILSGTPPSELPAVRPRKVRYVLNVKTARHMKLELSPRLVSEANQVFE